jgi:predicted ATPase/transcriptional regulator with XRE-family HTH domain
LVTEFQMAEDGPMSSPAPLAALIRTRRVSARLTQEELAEKAGISVRTISDIERGLRRSVYRDTAERLAEALEVGSVEKEDFILVARGRGEGYEPGLRLGPRVASSGRNRVPVPPTPLIGRERELEMLLGAFREGSIRSISLTGPGGIGKTRLAVEVAVAAQEIYEDGVFFVPIGPSESSARVVPLIAEALGMVEPESRTVADVSTHLGSAAILLVLDTFEHVLGAAASVAELLSSCHRLTVLVTSREPLRIRGEHVIALPPLRPPPKGSTDLSASSAGRLLLERARAAKADLVIDEESSVLLADICRRLDGLPLAIELAASRVRHLPLVRLREQLDARLSVLTQGGEDLPRRQRTMRGAIGWSYDLLDSQERSLFRSLSVFRSGWTLKAAQDALGNLEEDVVETLSALVDKSLVLLTAAESQAPRYSMMDVIGEFAREQRDRYGEGPELLRSHASYFLSLAERAEEKVGTSGQEQVFEELLAENDNLRVALAWSLSDGDRETGLRLAAALWQFWRAAGYLTEGRTWLEQAIRGTSGAPDLRAKALWGACWLAFQQDDLRSARRYSEELLQLTGDDEASLMRRNALTVQAMVHIAEGDFATALAPLERSAVISDAGGVSWYMATSKLNLALGLLHLRRLDEASSLLDEALELYVRLGDQRFAARAHVYQGHLALLRGDTERASDLFCQSVRRFNQVGDQGGIAEALEGLAAVSAATGSMDQAALLLGTARHARERSTSKILPFERALIERWLDEAQGALGEERWTDLLEKGGAMDIVAALEVMERKR